MLVADRQAPCAFFIPTFTERKAATMAYYERVEQETICLFDALEKTWSIYTTFPPHIKKLLSNCGSDRIKLMEVDADGLTIATKLSWIEQVRFDSISKKVGTTRSFFGKKFSRSIISLLCTKNEKTRPYTSRELRSMRLFLLVVR